MPTTRSEYKNLKQGYLDPNIVMKNYQDKRVATQSEVVSIPDNSNKVKDDTTKPSTNTRVSVMEGYKSGGFPNNTKQPTNTCVQVMEGYTPGGTPTSNRNLKSSKKDDCTVL